MLSMTTLLLATGLSTCTVAAAQPPPRIDVDCAVYGALERALARAARTHGADIHIYGVCPGGIVIATDGVTLRGATPDAALEAPDSPYPPQALVEIENAQVSLRNLKLRGTEVGVLADGWDASVLLFGVELSGQEGGVYARNGAEVRLIDSTVRDGGTGVTGQFNAVVRLQDVSVTGQDYGVVVLNGSRAAIFDSTIENNRTVGVYAVGRCDALVSGGSLRENGDAHAFAANRSDMTLFANVIVGSETDATGFALGVNEHSSMTSYNTPEIHGDLLALDGGSFRIGNTMVRGRLHMSIFSDAYVSSAEIVDGVFCDSGSDVVCSGNVTTPSVDGCPSTTCGVAAASAPDRQPSMPQLPSLPAPRVLESVGGQQEAIPTKQGVCGGRPPRHSLR